jgi:hypothetical protein
VAPQLSRGWQYNYSTKTRPEGRADEQSFFSSVWCVTLDGQGKKLLLMFLQQNYANVKASLIMISFSDCL